MLVTEEYAGERIDLNLLHTVLLNLREISHLRLSKFGILNVLSRELVDAVLDVLSCRESERCRRHT